MPRSGTGARQRLCPPAGIAPALKVAEEIVAGAFVPTWRSLLVRKLTERGLSQMDVATLTGISQSAVSKHLQGRLGPDPRLVGERRIEEAAERVAAGLAARTMGPFEALLETEALVRSLEDRGPLCRIHEEEMPSLAGLGCDICIRVSGSALGPEQAALTDLKGALRVLEATPGVAALVPHVGSNLARAVPGATDVTHVAAVPGRLFVVRGALKVPAPPEFGVSRHTGAVLLAVLRADPARLAVMNVAPTPALLDAARAAGLRVERVPPEVEREPASLRFAGPVPDLFHHGGAFGVEPQAYLTGEDAASLALRLRALVSRP